MSRPTTPLRRHSQSRIEDSLSSHHYDLTEQLPLESQMFSSNMVELDDGMAQLDANLQNIQQIHESVQCFNESFSAFLYGLQMNAWCVEFPEAPTHAAFERNADIKAKKQREREAQLAEEQRQREIELEQERQRQATEQKLQEEEERARQQLERQRENTNRRYLKRPADYSSNRPAYGRPVIKTRKPTKPVWK